MKQKYLFWMLLFFGILTIWGAPTVLGTPLHTALVITADSDDFETQYEQGQELFKTAGLAAYFEERSLLWTETNKRRNELQGKLPVVSKKELERFRIGVFQLLELNPHDPLALLFAGNYHDYCRQKQTALWYYQQAFEYAPQMEAVKLALADYYLNEWQPEKVTQILSGSNTPAICLRKGAASLQSGKFTLALGYLLRATPLPTPWQVTCDKDLFKAYLALGETRNASSLVSPNYLQGTLSATLFRELMGWGAYSAGNLKAALSNWNAGKNANSGYKLWESNIHWLSPDTHISLANATKEFQDPDLDAAFEINQGRILLQQGQWDLAYKQYLDAIHHDHRSLVGFLGAASVQLLKKNFKGASDLCNQGLAVNPGFRPLLVKRAEALEKMGRPAEAAKDKSEAGRVFNTKPEGTILGFQEGKLVILIQDKMKDLVGVWISESGNDWKWYPWWGGPVDIGRPLKKAWVVPCGPGISGQAFYVEQPTPPPVISRIAPLIQEEQAEMAFPFPVQLVVEVLNPGHRIYIGEQMASWHQIPLSFFRDTQNPIRIRWQNETGLWGDINCSLDLSNLSSSVMPAMKPAGPLQFSMSTPTRVTRYRRIAVHLTVAGGEIADAYLADNPGSTDPVWVSLGEADSPMEWQPFGPVIDYTLSPGDGLKRITGRLKDSEGHIQEDYLNIQLDSTAPALMLYKDQVEDEETPSFRIRWSAGESVTCWLRIFTKEGKWQTIPVTADSGGIFTGDLSPRDEVYCQIVARDNAGNITILQDDAFNHKLRQAAPVAFEVNFLQEGAMESRGNRWIQIKSLTPDLQWEASNDQSIWSNWQGDKPLTWRTLPGEHQLIFIRYKTADAVSLQYLVIPVLNQDLAK